MKLKNFGEAEKHCRKVLQESLEDNKAESDDHCCTQCTLATCLYLSAQHREAEALFRQIRRHGEMLARHPARDFYQVLCLTRVAQTDCSVLRDSSDGFQDFLVEIHDYVAQLDGPAFSVLATSISSPPDKRTKHGSPGMALFRIKSVLPTSVRKAFSRFRKAFKKRSYKDIEAKPLVVDGGKKMQQVVRTQQPQTEVPQPTIERQSTQSDPSSHWLGLRRSLKPARVPTLDERREHEQLPAISVHPDLYPRFPQPVSQMEKVELWLNELGLSMSQSQEPALPASDAPGAPTKNENFDFGFDEARTEGILGHTERSDSTTKTTRSSVCYPCLRLDQRHAN